MDDPQAVAGRDATGPDAVDAAADDQIEPDRERAPIGQPAGSKPAGWTDELTGTDGPRFWYRLIERERARVGRYRRPATVAFVELGGLDRLARRWGQDVAEEALRTCARTLAGEIRSSDHLARVEGTRFAILLTETDEIAAINFIERARVASEHNLRAAGEEIVIGFGWASPPAGGDLDVAVAQALARLAAELGEPPAG